MKKVLSLALCLALVFSCITAFAGGGGEELLELGDLLIVDRDVALTENGSYVIDTGATLTFTDEIGAVGATDYYTDAICGDDIIRINAHEDTRFDNIDPWSLDSGSDEIVYYKSGATVQFLKEGYYVLSISMGFESYEDRLEYLNKFEDPMYAPMDYIVLLEVVGETIVDETQPPELFDSSLISISNIAVFTYDEETNLDYIANSLGPVEIATNKDLKNFVVTSLELIDGVWIEQDLMMTDETGFSFGEFVSAKKGAKYTIDQPGYYSVWADDYEGNYTGITVYIEKPLDAKYTDSKVLVDGKEVKFEAYNIKDNNYFKLRDIAMVLNGTSKQFEVSWSEATNSIQLRPGESYTVVGGELAQGDGQTKIAGTGTKDIVVYDEPVALTAYMINGNNYFKLRDLGKLFDFSVSWDEANNCVVIDSTLPYTE